ncbi:hypothetical protein L2V44_14205, partial [Staphylococcus aureus]|nr:hypothetical protein [Staphylococcus aureus]
MSFGLRKGLGEQVWETSAGDSKLSGQEGQIFAPGLGENPNGLRANVWDLYHVYGPLNKGWNIARS